MSKGDLLEVALLYSAYRYHIQRNFIWRNANNFGYCSIFKDTNSYQAQVQSGRLKADVLGSTTNGDNITATASASALVDLTINKRLLTKAEILKLSGVPGKGITHAPGLQKLFNPKSKAAEHAGKKNKERI